MKKVFMFDVESDGLLGEGFAVGGVLATIENGSVKVEEEFSFLAGMNDVKDDWVRENVLPNINPKEFTVFETREQMRKAFWEKMQEAKEKGYEIWSDCNWPVETSFLTAAVAESGNPFSGPYPLYDLANLLDVNISRAEYSGKKYTHNPKDDATASLYCLAKVL